MKKSQYNPVRDRALEFLKLHSTAPEGDFVPPLDGQFALHPGQTSFDLYGMVDSVYILYILGLLDTYTNHASRSVWAKRILACQDQDGWFSKKNLRGHSNEHATAYALGALNLLSIAADERYYEQIKLLAFLKPLLVQYDTFLHWIETLNFRFTPRDILHKNLGWHHIWRGSHIGGGVAAIIGMTQNLFNQWWPGQVNSGQWFKWYIDWLNQHANPRTGYWQRAFWNVFYRKPTMIDMGGAAHFFWIYDCLGQPYPYPEAMIQSTIPLQKADGLYKNHPFCIDLDGNFTIIRAYLQLQPEKQSQYRDAIYYSTEKNFEAVVNVLTSQSLEQVYNDSHGLPGALAALVECAKLPDFKHTSALAGWQNPFDKVWWL